jgi:ABC-2 type transport system permease protein
MATLVPVVARQQWRLLTRDRRLAILGLALLLVLGAAALTSAALYRAQEAERAAAQVEEAQVWARQGPANPHGAAHFGRYVYKPLSPLGAVDPGLLPQLGTTLFLEAHAQNPARGRAIDGGTALDRFSGLSPASMLQVLAPLLIILAGFATFAGERARSLLRQELAAGAPPSALIAGRLGGLAATVAILLCLVAAIGVLALSISGAAASAYGALLWMLLGYALYLFAFAALTVAASAAFASARTALVVLLAFWAMATLFVPRIAPAIAEAAAPTLSGPAFEAAVTKEVREGPSGHDPQDARLERLKVETMKRYGVTRLEDLPVDFGGISLFHGEALSTAIYRRHFADLYDGYDRQADVQRTFALLSPFQAIRPWSAALAASDQHAHRRFLEQAEDFRYAVVQRLNRDIIRNRKQPAAGAPPAPYLADVAAITRDVRFAPRPVPLGEALARHWIDLLILIAWAVAAAGLAFAAARRLARLSA